MAQTSCPSCGAVMLYQEALGQKAPAACPGCGATLQTPASAEAVRAGLPVQESTAITAPLPAPRERRSKTWLLLAAAVLVVAAGAVVAGWLLSRPGAKPDIRTYGGTILAYELKCEAQKGSPSAADLVERIQKRIDHAGLRQISVRLGERDRIELLIPKVGDHNAAVQDAKDLLRRGGQLEFRILANAVDDMDGIEWAKSAVFEAEDHLERAERGMPPPRPTQRNNPAEPEVFVVNLPRGQVSVVSYSWVELGRQERGQLNLDNAARLDPSRKSTWIEATSNLNKPKQLRGLDGRLLQMGALYLCRRCVDRNLPKEEREEKEFDYFVLARDPELDTAHPQKPPTPKIDGSFVVSAIGAPASDGRPSVHFTLSQSGGELFGNLTRKNVPSGDADVAFQVKRHLAIILDGLVMSAPTINSEIGTQGEISGVYTQKEVEHMAGLLMSGPLPDGCRLHLIAEKTVAPGHGD